MKMVVAIIRPERLPGVQHALDNVNAELMTVTETHSYGKGEGHTLVYRSSEVRVRSAPKLRLEILTEDFEAEEVIDAILHTAFPNGVRSSNECRIFVVALEHYCDVTEGEREAVPVRSR